MKAFLNSTFIKVRNVITRQIYALLLNLSKKKPRHRMVVGSKKEMISTLYRMIAPFILQHKEDNSYLPKILPPYQISSGGMKIDSIEAFCRSFIGTAYLIYAERYNESRPSSYTEIVQYYSDGVLSGMDSLSDGYWGEDNHQVIENTSIIIGLLVAKYEIWDNYSDDQRLIIINYIKKFLDKNYYINNWLWFKIFHLAFLNNYTEVSYSKEIALNLLEIESMYIDRGWFTDGKVSDGGVIDYYSAWAMQYYLLVFIHFFGDDFSNYKENKLEQSHSFLEDFNNFFTPGGSTPFFGRSQLYGCATIAPFGYLLSYFSDELDYEVIRKSFVSNFNILINECGLLPNGFLAMGVLDAGSNELETYSGTGSPYWAFKFFSMLLLDDDHPFWLNKAKERLNSECKIVTLSHIDFMLAHKGDGQIILIKCNYFKTNGVYLSKYNKFAYCNILEKSPFYNKCKFDSMAFVKIHGKWCGVGKVYNTNTHDGCSRIDWSPDGDNTITITTYLIAVPDGYIFKHVLISSYVVSFRCTGFPVYGCNKEVVDSRQLDLSGVNGGVRAWLMNNDSEINKSSEYGFSYPDVRLNNLTCFNVIGYFLFSNDNLFSSITIENDQSGVFSGLVNGQEFSVSTN